MFVLKRLALTPSKRKDAYKCILFALLSLSEDSVSAVFDQDSFHFTDSVISDLDLSELMQP